MIKLIINKLLVRLVFVFFALGLYDCVLPMDIRYTVSLKNESTHPIGCYFALGGNFGTMYPDTTLPSSNHYIINGIKEGKRYYYDSSIEWEAIFDELPRDTLSVFIFHTDTLNKYPWEKVRDEYMILKRYDLGLDDLKRQDYTITYPQIVLR